MSESVDSACPLDLQGRPAAWKHWELSFGGTRTGDCVLGGAKPPTDNAYESEALYAIPEGWTLVPIDPTPEMIAGFWGDITHGEPEVRAAKDAYKAMLDALPNAESSRPREGD